MNTEIIITAFENAKNDTKELPSSKKNNSLRSTCFVEKVGEELIKYYDRDKFRCYCQHFNKETIGKTSGEWMLDLVICEFHPFNEAGITHEFRANIEWAVESEFNTSLKEFLEDFTKLLNICSKNKLYLNGYRSKSPESYSKYVQRRIETAADLIKKYNKGGNFYLGFWPSPQEYQGESFWEISKNYQKIINVYKWDYEKKYFVLI